MAEFLDQLLSETNTLRGPLADSPAGTDIALEPEFETIKAEIDKLSSLNGGQVDWRAVVKGAEELLSTRTKDLRLALWMACGEVERGGWKGLARSLTVCRALVTDFWDTMYPPRPKARANIAAWFGERVNPQLQALSVDRENADAVRACEELVNEIDSVLTDKLGDVYSGMGSVRNTMRARIRDIPKDPPPPPPPPTPPPPKPAVVAEVKPNEWGDDEDEAPAPPPRAKKEDWGDDDETAAPAQASRSNGASGNMAVALSVRAADAAATTVQCGTALVQLAHAMRMEDPSRAWAYRLHRTGIWLSFDPGQPASIRAPHPDVVAAMQTLFADGRWLELLLAAEEASASAPYWLDAQRHAAMAAERLGLAFSAAREVIGRDTTELVKRASWLREQTMEDGASCANEETRAWLTAETQRWDAIPDIGESSARAEDTRLRKRFEEARDLVTGGRHEEGLARASELARRASNARGRFKASLAVAKLALSVSAFDVARPLLDSLFATAEAHSLETWEPDVSAELYTALLQCFDHEASAGMTGATERRAQVFERLCRVSPASAFRTRSGGKPVAAPQQVNALIRDAFPAAREVPRSVAFVPQAAPVAAPSAPMTASAARVVAAAPEPITAVITDAGGSQWADDD